MKKSLFVFFSAAMIFFGFILFSKAATNFANNEENSFGQEWMPCTVSDPTGTPLNVRAKANGKIIAKLKNGTLVEIDDLTAADKWSRINFKTGKKTMTGWVLRAYLSCQ